MAQPAAAAIATARIPGIDVARAFAVLGMVLVNFKLQMDASSHGPGWMVWWSERLDGRAAALFVLLAGLGISLRSRRARAEPARFLGGERRALVERALVLFVAGLLNLHLWDWDILHCYGVYLLLAALLLNAPGWVLWAIAALCTVAVPWVRPWAEALDLGSFWSPRGAALDLLGSGLHPIVPWFAFLAVGMWVGRLPLGSRPVRLRLLGAALVVGALAEGVGALAQRSPEVVEAWWAGGATWLYAGPWPPGPVFVLACCSTAIAVICGCIEATEGRADSRAVVALVATGQLAFTLYIAHALAIIIPLQHGLFVDARLWVSIAYGCAFFAVSVWASVWWRRRFAQGPLEGFIRQITGRTTPAPWGGQLAKGPPRN